MSDANANELSDRIEIANVLYRYAKGIDDKNLQQVLDCFSSDIEMDLLDERQLTMRDAAFADAYSILWRVITALIVLYLVWPYFFPAPRDPYRSGYGILVPLLFFTGFLPTMVLAWTLPSEQPEA